MNSPDAPLQATPLGDQAEDVAVEIAETLHDGFVRFQRLGLRHRRHDGGWSPTLQREVLIRDKAVVALLPYDPHQDHVLLVEQFRPGPYVAGRKAWIPELVAGLVDPGESLAAACEREAREEAGLTLRKLLPLHGYFPSPGVFSEFVNLFLAVADLPTQGSLHGHPGEDEDIRTLVLPFATAWDWGQEGRICDAATLIALYGLNGWRTSLREQGQEQT